MPLAVTEKPNVDSYTQGVSYWFDLQAEDSAAARETWGELMGWTFENVMPAGQGEYWMAYRGGCVVGAVSELSDDDRKQGIPPHVFTYFNVVSADDIAKKVTAAGGKVLAEPFDVFESGRMGVFMDPQGGTFGVWQGKEFKGAELVNSPGSLSWNELITGDIEGAQKFYSAVFGWTFEDASGDNFTYYMWKPAGSERPGGGLMAKTPEMGDIPTVWNVIFATDDCDVAVDKVTAAGGVVQMAAIDMEFGRYAQVADAQGISFGLIKLKG